MWDPGTAALAIGVVTVGSLVAPPMARGIGGVCAIIGFFGVMQGSTWAPTVAALGALAWLVGHWSVAVRNDVRYRSRLARAAIDKTPLKWSLPQYWPRRKRTSGANDR